MKLTFIRIPKSFLVVFCVLLLANGLIAQDAPLLVKAECKEWRGKTVAGDVAATCFSGKGKIQAVYADTLHTILYALVRDMKNGKLRKTGSLVAYDFGGSRELWNTPFDYSKEQFFLADSIPIISQDFGSRSLDRKTGTVIWKILAHVGMTTANGVGVAQPYANRLSLSGIDLRNGKEIWNQPARFDDIESFEIHGDTCAIFLSKGLHYINLDTGLGFYIKAKTSENKRAYNPNTAGAIMLGGMLGGVIGGLIFGVAFTYIPPSSAKSAQRSANSLTDMYMNDEGIFFSSYNDFYKVSFTGDVIWKIAAGDGGSYIRKVFLMDNNIYVLTKGMVNSESGPVYSDAVLFRVDKDTEGSFQSIQLNTGKREYVQDFLVQDSTVMVAMNNRLQEISLADLSVKKERVFGDVNQNSGFGDILNPPAIIYTDSVFKMDSELHPNDFFVENSNGMKIRFSSDLEPVEVIREEDYFTVLRNLGGGRKLVTNGTDDYLIDADGKKVLELAFSANVKVLGEWIFDFEEVKVIGVRL